MAKTKETSKNRKWEGLRYCTNSHQTLVQLARLKNVLNNSVDTTRNESIEKSLNSLKRNQSLNTSTKTAAKMPRKALQTLGGNLLKTAPKTVRATTIVMPMPPKRSKRISLKEEMKLEKLSLSVSLGFSSAYPRTRGRTSRETTFVTSRTTISKVSNSGEFPLIVNPEVSSAYLRTGGRLSRKTTSKTSGTTKETPTMTPDPSKRSKRSSLTKQSSLEKLPLSESWLVSSAYLKTRGKPSQKVTSKTPRTTSDTQTITTEPSKRSKRSSLTKQSSLEKLPLSESCEVSSAYLKTRGRPSRKVTSKTPRTTSDTSTITPKPSKITPGRNVTSKTPGTTSDTLTITPSKRTRGRPSRKITSKTPRTTTPEATIVPLLRSKKSTAQTGSDMKGLCELDCTITPAPEKRSISLRNHHSLKDRPRGRPKRISLSDQNNLDKSLNGLKLCVSSKSRKTQRNQPKTVNETVSKKPKKGVSGTVINGSQVIRKTAKDISSLKPKKTTKVAMLPSRSPTFIDFKVCDEISISQNEILETQTKNTCLSTSKTLSNLTPNKLNNRRNTIRVSSLEPLICKRNTPVCDDRSDIQLAKEALHVSAVQETLICRETKFKEIYELIECNILENSGGCIYVSGVPGTGKTATISKVIKSLQLQTGAKKLPDFQFIEINGMRLTEPEQAYVHIYHQITKVKVSWEQACSSLEKLFNTSSLERKITVLVLDEFDKMKSRRERVIFNLLDWATKKTAQLFLIAIGNIITPSQLLTSAQMSRLGSTCFTFLPYTHNELQKIVQARLTGINIFDSDAIMLVAKKVASISGDCRRALDICRRAVEIGEKDCAGKDILISTAHVCKAFDEMITTNLKVIAIKGCSKYEKFFLQAVAAEVARTGVDETVLFQVYRQLETICALNGVSVPDPGIALRISSRLGSSRLLICEHSSASIHQKIMLNVTDEEIRYAFDM